MGGRGGVPFNNQGGQQQGGGGQPGGQMMRNYQSYQVWP
jgi:hypothetical protein